MADLSLESLAGKIDALSPPDKLRLAAHLLDEAVKGPEARSRSLCNTARAIAEKVAVELGAALLLSKDGG